MAAMIALGLGATVQAATNVSHRFVPELKPFTEERFQKLKVPPGFRINVFATGQGASGLLWTAESNGLLGPSGPYRPLPVPSAGSESDASTSR